MPTDKPGAPPGGFEAYAADDHSLGLFRSPRKAVADDPVAAGWWAISG
jgi:hypothetical protein